MVRVFFSHPFRLTSSDMITSAFCRDVTYDHNSVTLHDVETLITENGQEWAADGTMVVFIPNVAAVQHLPPENVSPDERKDVWQFLLRDLRKQRQFVDDQERIGGWLREAQARWEEPHESEEA